MKMSEVDFKKLFNEIDNSFVGSEEHVHNYQKKYTNYFDPQKGYVADIGCGQGAFLRALEEKGIRAMGVDSNLANIMKINEKKEKNGYYYEAIWNDAFHFLDTQHDLLGGIFMAHMIEHYDGYSAVRLLVFCHEALKSGGTIVVITPNFADDHIHKTNFWLSSTHIRPYPKEWLVNAIGKIGFHIVDSGYDPNGGDTFVVGTKK